MKEKRLLFLEQPFGDFNGIPRGVDEGIEIEHQPAKLLEIETFAMQLNSLLEILAEMNKEN